MLQAMNTGHDGSLTTIHANSPRDGVVPSRGHGRHGECEYEHVNPSGSRSSPRSTCWYMRRGSATGRGRVTHLPRWWAWKATDHDAGHLRFREDGVTEPRQGHGTISRHRHPARNFTIAKTAAFNCRPRCSRPLWRSARRTRCRFPSSSRCVVIFALVLVCVGLGMKYFEARRKKHVTGMLQTVAGQPAVSHSQYPARRGGSEPVGDRAGDDPVQLHRKGAQRTPAGGYALVAAEVGGIMAVCAGIGCVLGLVFPLVVSPAVTVLILASAGGFLPYFVVHSKRIALANIEEQFPEALDFLARSMRAGHAFTISLEMIGDEIGDPLGQEFRTLFDEQTRRPPGSGAAQPGAKGCRCSMCASFRLRCCCKKKPAAT